MKQIQKLWKLLLIAGFTGLPQLLTAQPGGADDVLDNPVPFDSGVFILVGVAVWYGVKKIGYKKKTESL